MAEKSTREQIADVLEGLYLIPGEFFIVGLVAKGIGKSFLPLTNWGYILIFLGIVLIVMEIISPFIAGMGLYEKAVKNVKKIFKYFMGKKQGCRLRH